jgi:hypothetical protein
VAIVGNRAHDIVSVSVSIVSIVHVQCKKNEKINDDMDHCSNVRTGYSTMATLTRSDGLCLGQVIFRRLADVHESIFRAG